MKRRARRAMILTAALVAVVVAVLVVANWGTVRDHVEAWHFQLTRDTKRIEPALARSGMLVELSDESEGWRPLSRYRTSALLDAVANYSGCPVVFASEDGEALKTSITLLDRKHIVVTDDMARVFVEANGWRLLEQRFPRRAYVVILDEDRTVPIIQYRGKNRWTGPIIQYRNPDQP